MLRWHYDTNISSSQTEALEDANTALQYAKVNTKGKKKKEKKEKKTEVLLVCLPLLPFLLCEHNLKQIPCWYGGHTVYFCHTHVVLSITGEHESEAYFKTKIYGVTLYYGSIQGPLRIRASSVTNWICYEMNMLCWSNEKI